LGLLSVRRLLTDGRTRFGDAGADDDVDLLVIDATRDKNDAIDVTFEILARPEKSFEDQKNILERLLRRFDESSKLEILRSFVEKFSQPSIQ